ncbi:multidrug ABC transporter ATP-binding protein [Actinomyces oris]|uniref:Fatty acid ABC transporter ATP-binding/permease protein n=2 Tax=Actinomyces oris TaxID=544580 RepID=A0A1Q8VSC5_9ACTO|nr:ABC transporter ATP-binding protein [Actinomyces oris]OLO50983.1 multidrug ABC transporter ATP-binding protein [Actinomyces oris]OLO57958.1 multidrug ABC transporter ATP-binding protein [Actinomyces oris]OLO59669.1 multidrug ABC transporter ATP-binding protein [Actinomyces oris]
MGKNTSGNTGKSAGSGAGTTVGPDELSEEDLKLAAEAQASSGDRHAGPPPGKAEAFWPSFKRMVGLLGAYRVSLVVVALAAVGTVVLAVAAPKVLGQATNVIFEGVVSTMLPAGTTKAQAIEALRARGMDDFATMLSAMDVVPGAGIDYTRLGRILTVVLALYVGSAALNWLQGWLINRITIKALYRLRAQVEDKVHRLPLSYFDTVQRGELLSRLTNDVDNVTNTLQQSLSGALTAILTVVGVLGMMFSISWKLALVALIMFPLMGVVFGVIGPRSQKAFTHQWARTGKINTRVEESFSGHALVQVYGRTDSVREAFAAENEELFRASLRAQFLSGIMMPIMQVIGNINYVAIAVVGGAMVASGSLRLGDVQAFIQYSQQFSQPLSQLGGMATAVQSGTASAERIFELLDAEEERPDDVAPKTPAGTADASGAAGTATADAAGDAAEAANADRAAGASPSAATASPKGPTGPGVIEMEHVRFSYSPEVELIRDLSLRVDPGHTVAIVGPTGAGKTTLVNLLMRFYELDGGRILIDGRDIATMTRHDVRRRTGMVLQDPWLFAGTIRENIRYGRPGATDEEVEAAARACFVDHIIKALPQGYDTVLEEDAANISAGERQLLTIARAFVANPAVLILDEATSSVDTRTELLVQQAMNALREGRTSFIIAHRLSTIRDADTILVMEHGDIVEQGNHDELIAAGGAYARLHAAQFAGGATVAVED